MFSEITKCQYLWEGLGYFVCLFHVVTDPLKLHWYHVVVVADCPLCPKFSETINHQYLWKLFSDFADFLHVVFCILLDINWSYKNMLLWVAIARSRLSTNQILKCFKQEKLENYMRCHVDFLLLLELQKNHAFWGYDPKKLLADLFTGFFTFELFDLLILIPGIHCCIVLVFFYLFTNEAVLYFY